MKNDLTKLTDQELQEELVRRNVERQAPKRKAMQRLGIINTEINSLFIEATDLCKVHGILFNYQLDNWQVSVDSTGYRSITDSWSDSSVWEESDLYS
jgi:hypothetical protein